MNRVYFSFKATVININIVNERIFPQLCSSPQICQALQPLFCGFDSLSTVSSAAQQQKSSGLSGGQKHGDN